MSAYTINVIDREGTVAASVSATSLADAATTMLELAAHAHDDDPGTLIDADGHANIQVRGEGNRELDAVEKERFTALLAEFGGDKLDDNGPAGTWSLPDPEEA